MSAVGPRGREGATAAAHAPRAAVLGVARPVGARGWLALPLVLLVRLYQVLLSPLMPASCKYHPTCSTYALRALQQYGPVRGGYLAAHRLLACHPWSDGGVDPVPERWQDRPRFGTVRHGDSYPYR